jgi:tRNA-splicing ligase RtcB
MKAEALGEKRETLAHDLYRTVPAGVGWGGAVRLTIDEMDQVLLGGARWAVESGWGDSAELLYVEENGCMKGADPSKVSRRAKERQLSEMGTLGSGNHYLELQVVDQVFDAAAARRFRLEAGDLLVTIHCGSRGLGHQIGTDYLQRLLPAAGKYGIALPDRELSCAPILSPEGSDYLGAMRAGINCALANRQVIGGLVRRVFARHFPQAALRLLYDVSHNTCKAEEHLVAGAPRRLFVHRKGATRAFGPGHPDLPEDYRGVGQPVLIEARWGPPRSSLPERPNPSGARSPLPATARADA